MKKAILITVILFFAILLPPSVSKGAAATDTSEYDILGSIGGTTNTIAVKDNYVYIGKGTSVLILEKLEGGLTQVGLQLKLPSYVSDLKIDGKYLYAAAGSAGLYILDISTPLTPTKVSTFVTAGFAEAVVVRDQTAYLADGLEGLQIIDISDKAKPTALSRIYQGYYVYNVTLDGNKAYIAAADDGLLIADVTKSSAPEKLGSYNTPGIARYVVVSGKYAYVADDWKGISVVDISSSAAPFCRKTISTAGRAHGLALDRNILYVADAYMGLRVFDLTELQSPKDISSFIPADSQMTRAVVDGHFLYGVDRANGVTCFDITDPSKLQLKGFYSHTIPTPMILTKELQYWDDGRAITRLMVLGVMDSETVNPDKEITRAELAVLLCKALRLKDTADTKKATFLDVPKSYWAYGYIEQAVKLGLITRKDKTHFDPEGSLTYAEVLTSLLRLVNREPGSGTWPENCIKKAEELGINAPFCRGDTNQNMLRGNVLGMLEKVLAEITDSKTKMTILQNKFGIQLQAFPMVASDVAVNGDYAYVVSGAGGLSVVSAGNPKDLRQVSHLDFTESVTYIKIKGSYAYVFSYFSVYTVNISNPLAPYTVSRLSKNINGPVRGVSIDGDRIYTADEWGIKIYSISNPAKPELLAYPKLMDQSKFGNFSSTSDIAVRNGIAYVAFEFRGLCIYDVSDADNVKYLRAYTNERNFITNVQFADNKALIKCGSMTDILNIDDIRNPYSIGKFITKDGTQNNYAAGIDQNRVLIPVDSDGISIVDIKDPISVKELKTIDTVGIPVKIILDGELAYEVDTFGGINVIALAGGSSITSSVKSRIVTDIPLSYRTDLLCGDKAVKYALSGEKAEAVINNQSKRYPGTLTVTNTKSSGKGSLAWCLDHIMEGGCILFDTKVFTPAKPAVIYLSDTIRLDRVNNITLDASNAGVIIDGRNLQQNSNGIDIASSGNVIKGFRMQNLPTNSINIRGRNNIIGGSRAKGAGPSGEGNVIINSGGIMISGGFCRDNILVGNNIGVEADGVTPAGNLDGIALRNFTSRNVIGIDKPEYRNVISANKNNGISSMGSAFGNLIEGNYVGTDITGMVEMGNFNHGISFELTGFGTIVRNNVSCGNGRYGLLIGDNLSSYNVILGNHLSVGADGEKAIRNYEWAMRVAGGMGGGICYNIIGGKDEAYVNLTYDLHPPENLSEGTYDSVFNGVVYKYRDMDRY